MKKKKAKKRFLAALGGSILIAICCFTPLLVVTLSLIGLSILNPYLDFILFPSLGLLIILTVLSYLKWKKQE